MEDKTIKELFAEMEEIRASWNGDNAGREEDNVMIAKDIQILINNIRSLYKDLVN